MATNATAQRQHHRARAINVRRIHLRTRELIGTHLAVFALVAVWVGVAYPRAALLGIPMVACGIIAELAPSAWRRRFFAEILQLSTVAITLAWARHLDHGQSEAQAFSGWLRLLLAFWILIPVRPAMLRWLVGLIAAELLLLGHDSVSRAIAPVYAAPWLVTVALVALALDGHTRIRAQRHEGVVVGRTRSAGAGRWIALPLVVAAGAAAVIGPQIRTFSQPPPLTGDQTGERRGNSVSNLDTRMHIGDHAFVDRDPTPMARMDAEQPLTQRTWYLRAMTVPQLVIDGPRVNWIAADLPRLAMPDLPQLHTGDAQEAVSILRYGGSGDVVLYPDGSASVSLFDLIADPDGNLYRSRLGQRPARYVADLGSQAYPAPSWQSRPYSAYTDIPDDLAATLRNQLPLVEAWAEVPPLDAANAIATWLGERCRYQITDLPVPDGGRADSLLQFMFGSPEQRVGHCQYFATATTLLLRAAGHPARCVVGFASNEVDDSSVMFRALNAHAWIEVLVPQPEGAWWVRVDPTPAGFLQTRSDGIDYFRGETAEPDAVDPNQGRALEDDTATNQISPWLIAGLSVLGAIMLVLLSVFLRRHRHQAQPANERFLKRQSEGLVAVALDLGLPVDSSTTLTALAGAIQGRTGIDLGPHLAQHLRARYADGPLPPPWPLSDLRDAARQHRRESRRLAKASSRSRR